MTWVSIEIAYYQNTICITLISSSLHFIAQIINVLFQIIRFITRLIRIYTVYYALISIPFTHVSPRSTVETILRSVFLIVSIFSLILCMSTISCHDEMLHSHSPFEQFLIRPLKTSFLKLLCVLCLHYKHHL